MVRIIKRNLVYIIGVPEEIAKVDVNYIIKDFKQTRIFKSIWENTKNNY